MDHSGLWTLVTIVGPLVLLAALLYGAFVWRDRRRSTDVMRDTSTRDLFNQPDEDDPRAVRPSEMASPSLAPDDGQPITRNPSPPVSPR